MKPKSGHIFMFVCSYKRETRKKQMAASFTALSIHSYSRGLFEERTDFDF